MEKLKQKDSNTLNFIYDGKYFGNGNMMFIPTHGDITNKKEINLLVELKTVFYMDNKVLHTNDIGRHEKEDYKGLEYLLETPEGQELTPINKTNEGVEVANNIWAYVFRDGKDNVQHFNAHFVKVLESHYPTATYKYEPSKLYILDGEEIVGCLMCMRV